MFNYNFFKQKSPQQRFLLILGLFMIAIFFGLAFIIAFTDILPLDPEKFPRNYQIAFAVLLIIYALIRFGRILKKDEE